jgi:hypothetical protein
MVVIHGSNMKRRWSMGLDALVKQVSFEKKNGEVFVASCKNILS